jgi:hypothetical protein
MAQRVFGPTRGAGVQITELEGDKPIEPGALGPTGYAGVFEKGPVGELVQASTKTSFLKKMGTYIDDGLAPDASLDFFDVGAGAGSLWLVRVTDGNELQSEITLLARRTLRTPMGTLKAKNGGRWGGKEKRFTADMALAGDLTNITLDTGLSTFTTDELKGGFIELDIVSNTRYPIIGNDNTGIVSVSVDATMKDDWTTAGSGNLRYYFVLDNGVKALSYEVLDGEENPTTEFKLNIYVDGVLTNTYPDLSTDPDNARYWVKTINDDGSNDEVEAVDLFTGQHLADVRPANHYGEVLTVTATVMNAVIHNYVVTSPGGGDPTFVLGTTTDAMLEQKITITMSTATEGTAVSDRFGALGTVTLGSLFDPPAAAGGADPNKWAPPFTVTAGGSPLVGTDVLTINYKPFLTGALINGFLFPDKVNARTSRFRIVGNDHDSITVADGSDLTVDAVPTDEFMVQFLEELSGGRDGNADLVDADYNAQAWDTSFSPFVQLFGKNLGLVKFTTPGVTSVAVQKSGIAFAFAKNYQYRVEIPSNVTTESGAEDFINSQVGRSNYAVASFPSFGEVADPTGGAGLRLTTLSGQIHGREAAFARDFNGYHKAAAGLDAVLPKVLKIPTGDTILDEEFLNPLGVSVIKKNKGNFVIWGDRTLFLDSEWKWKHQREQMSYYEHVLQESFDFIVFSINDPVTEKIAITALRSFFLPEFNKRALRGESFEDAAIIKIDSENNTTLTRAQGDLFADIMLRLADTVERFRIRIGKQGIFEASV